MQNLQAHIFYTRKDLIDTMQKFIISTENFIAKKIACKALKAFDNNETTHNLYIKACMNGGKIVISGINEMTAWRNAILAYKPMDKIEGKVYRVLVACAIRGCEKRLNNSPCSVP